ncbi:MAG: hypothetical protein OXP08_01325, partial [bacterium]|nr:hypothetical protein [bacterium]
TFTLSPLFSGLGGGLPPRGGGGGGGGGGAAPPRDRWAGMRRGRWAAAEPKQPRRPAGRSRLLTVPRVSVATIGLGGVVIVVCVTILKYTHILSESIGSLTP